MFQLYTLQSPDSDTFKYTATIHKRTASPMAILALGRFYKESIDNLCLGLEMISRIKTFYS